MPKACGPAWVSQLYKAAEGDYQLMNHQACGCDNLLAHKSWLLHHDVGTGKTLTICTALGLKGEVFHVADTTHMSAPKKKKVLQGILDADGGVYVVLATYEALSSKSMKDLLAKIKWTSLVMDESHKIKSAGSKCSRRAKYLADKNPEADRWCMTATPFANSPLDIYGQLRFMGVVSGTWSQFRDRYAVTHPDRPNWVFNYKNLDELHNNVNRVSCRASSDSVLDLPEQVHIETPVQLNTVTRKLYKSLDEDFVASIQDKTVSVDNPLTKLLRLQQITGGFYESNKIAKGTPEKAMALKEVIDHDKPVVVFCRFTKDLEQVAEVVGKTYLELSGKRNELDKWQKGDGRVLGVQIKSGGAGIDLTRASLAVFYSIGYSLADYTQACGRLHRPGQMTTTIFHHLVAKDTVDEQVYKAIQGKQQILDFLLRGAAT